MLYRESNPALKHNTWRSVAGTIDELKAVADKSKDEGSQAAKKLSSQIMLAIPSFEASEDVSLQTCRPFHSLANTTGAETKTS
jgi:hypothetical protein